jgi:hypothetical protein
MDILSLSFLLLALVVYDEIFNGQLKISQKLLQWFEQKFSRDR